MKKLLLAATSATILCSSLAFAEIGDNQWYLRADVGAVIFNKPKDKLIGLKLKHATDFFGDVGVGYSILDNVRTDLTLGMVPSVKLKKSGAGSIAGVAVEGTIKHKPQIISLLLNGYVDFADISMIKLFGGAGVGIGAVKEKDSYSLTVAGVTDSLNAKIKNKYNFIYQLTLGASAEVASGVNAELAYSWRDYGKTKSKTEQVYGNDVRVGGTRYQGHHITAGIRFDI